MQERVGRVLVGSDLEYGRLMLEEKQWRGLHGRFSIVFACVGFLVFVRGWKWLGRV